MGNIKRGSIVLIRYPFTDLSGNKVRPAAILTPDIHISKMDDILCLFKSSVIPDKKYLLPSDYILDEKHSSFRDSGLKCASVFRCHKIALLIKSLVIKHLGQLDNCIMSDISTHLCIALGISKE
jgi:mRNA interferase MazF